MSEPLPKDTPACATYDPAVDPGSYGYRPSLAWGLVFTIAFTIIAIGQTYHMLRTRTFWTFFFIIGALFEVVGWIGRLVGFWCPYSRDCFIMQTASLITGPGWAQAGIYLTLYVVIRKIGRHVSPFPPKTYLAICFCIDVTCLTTQAVGGGLAGASYNNNTSTQPGTITMVVGIITQLSAAVLFSLLVGFVMYRGVKELRANRPLFYMTSATAFATMMMIMRNVYRAIELTEGWRGYLIMHEKYVLALDALPMVLAMGIYVIFNPGTHFEARGESGRQEVEENDPARKNPVQRYLNL